MSQPSYYNESKNNAIEDGKKIKKWQDELQTAYNRWEQLEFKLAI